MKKFAFAFATLAMVVASAATSYKITLHQPSVLNGTELKAGEYKVTVIEDKAVLTKGRESVEAPVKVESNGSKFSSTTVRYLNGDGKYRISEIRLGGTNTKLIFN